MKFYDLAKDERIKLTTQIEDAVGYAVKNSKIEGILEYATDKDTYIRRNVSLSFGKIYRAEKNLRKKILSILRLLYDHSDVKVRQVAVYAAGEIGKVNFDDVTEILEKALFDSHHAVLNALTGALKQGGSKNPVPTVEFIKKHVKNVEAGIQVKLLHGLELRGRTHPEEILPILAEYQDESRAQIVKMVVHILGQISYKQGCLTKVLDALKSWHNKKLVAMALKEISTVHRNYAKFSSLSPEEMQEIIKKM